MDVSSLLDGLNDKQRDAVQRHRQVCWCSQGLAVAKRGY